jgi:hypothetical protein
VRLRASGFRLAGTSTSGGRGWKASNATHLLVTLPYPYGLPGALRGRGKACAVSLTRAADPGRGYARRRHGSGKPRAASRVRPGRRHRSGASIRHPRKKRATAGWPQTASAVDEVDPWVLTSAYAKSPVGRQDVRLNCWVTRAVWCRAHVDSSKKMDGAQRQRPGNHVGRSNIGRYRRLVAVGSSTERSRRGGRLHDNRTQPVRPPRGRRLRGCVRATSIGDLRT